MSREIMQQALDALKLVYEQADFSNGVTDPTGTMDEGKVVIGGIVSDAVAALEAELAKPEQEPVAWLPKWAHDRLTGQLGSVADPVTWGINTHIYAKSTPETVPLYTAPPRKEWVGLTDHDIELTFLISGFTAKNFAHAIEAKLKEKNT